MIIKRTADSDNSLIFAGFLYMGEHSLDDAECSPKEYAERFSDSRYYTEILYKTRIQGSSSSRLIKIFVR